MNTAGNKTELAFHSTQQVAADVDRLLRSYYDRQTRAAYVVDPTYGRLWKAIATLASAGGKRLRPYMTVLAYEMYGGQDYKTMLPVAASQELLHLSLLVHDDITDQATIRYGVPNVTGQYVEFYKAQGLAAVPARRYAEGAALLAGDLLMSAASAVATEAKLTDEVAKTVQQLLSEAVFNVAAGQLLDMEAGTDINYPVDAFKIARLKTASYSFVNPLRCGAVIAGAPNDEVMRLASLGSTLGMAFQLVDDLLGVFGDSQVTGKSNLTDLCDGKRTYLVQIMQDKATASQLAAIKPYFGSATLDDAQADVIRQVMVDCGARHIVEETVDRYQRKALHQVDTLQVSDEARQVMRELIQRVTKRDH